MICYGRQCGSPGDSGISPSGRPSSGRSGRALRKGRPGAEWGHPEQSAGHSRVRAQLWMAGSTVAGPRDVPRTALAPQGPSSWLIKASGHLGTSFCVMSPVKNRKGKSIQDSGQREPGSWRRCLLGAGWPGFAVWGAGCRDPLYQSRGQLL